MKWLHRASAACCAGVGVVCLLLSGFAPLGVGRLALQALGLLYFWSARRAWLAGR